MKPVKADQFNAKVLLFGEYSLLVGSNALSIPFNRFHGKLVWPETNLLNDKQLNSNAQIRIFSKHVSDVNNVEGSGFSIDINRLRADTDAGLFFESNIPHGYGLGSSGALVAAIFKAYSKESISDFTSEKELIQLKTYFALLESFFHGKSSGLDPLISYVNKPILISANNKPEIFKTSHLKKTGNGAIFLLDSGQAGETQPLVRLFNGMLTDSVFKQEFSNIYIPAVNNAIDNYSKGEKAFLFEDLKKLSGFQLKHFQKMIPDSINDVWENGLKTEDYFLKLCGSGGGGMVLGFTRDFEKTKFSLANFYPILVHHL